MFTIAFLFQEAGSVYTRFLSQETFTDIYLNAHLINVTIHEMFESDNIIGGFCKEKPKYCTTLSNTANMSAAHTVDLILTALQ